MAIVLPPLGRLVLWGMIGAVSSMLIYWVLSPQARISRLKAEVLEARRALEGFDGEFADAMPLMRHMMAVSFRHIGVVIGPAILASLPLLFLLVWISTAYGYALPSAATSPDLEVVPAKFGAQWERIEKGPPHLQVMDPSGAVIDRLTLSAPVPTLHQWQWWNTLIGNPAGYVPATAPYESVTIGLRSRDYLGFGPDWLRSWEVPFLAVLVAVSLAIKVAFRVQ